MKLSSSILMRLWSICLRCVLRWAYTSTDRLRTSEHLFMIGVAVLIGLLGGLGAVGFRWLIQFFQEAAHPDWGGSLEAIMRIPWYYKLIIPSVGGAVIGPLIYFGAREAKGHGVPEVMEAIALHGGRIRPRVVFIKSLASALTIGSGMSVGREGPIAQIGSAIGSTLGQIFKVNASRMRTFVSCGAAAGIAATFNAPIAGALFSLEIILSDFTVSQFSPIVISSVLATAISRHYLGDAPALLVPSYTLGHPVELLFYGVLGILAAVVGTAFIKILYFTEDIYDGIPIPEYFKPITGGLLVGATGLLFPHVYGVGYEVIDQALLASLGWQVLLVLIGAKLLATSITLGAGGSGGVFAPSLFIGSMLGGAFGVLITSLFPGLEASSGAYALVAMGAVVSATTRAPITSILIIFEMTNDYKLILPLIITCVLSTLLSAYLVKPSIYTLKLIRRGTDIHKAQEVNILRSLRVEDACEDDFETIPPQTPLHTLLTQLVESTHSQFYMVESDHLLRGVVTFDSIRNLLLDGEALEGVIVAHDLARDDLPALTPDESLDRVMLLFGQYHVDEFPIVEPGSNRLIGVIDRENVMNAYNREVVRRDLAGEFNSLLSTTNTRQVVELDDGFSMVELEAPQSFIGQSLRQLDVRARYGVQILLVKHLEKEKMTHFAPAPDYMIEEHDVLLLAGNKDRIQRARNL